MYARLVPVLDVEVCLEVIGESPGRVLLAFSEGDGDGALDKGFVVVGFLQPAQRPHYGWPIIAGLVLCWVGDLALALRSQRAFLVGLVAFLLGHVAYIVAFSRVAALTPWVVLGLLVGAGISVPVLFKLKPHLGSMRIPVMAYTAVITTMVVAATAVFGTPELRGGAVLGGAFAFYLSDLFVARERFVVADFKNRLVGLPLYYAGQFLLALSIGGI